MISKNIPRLTCEHLWLTILRDDQDAINKYAEWMSNECTSVNIEKNNIIVDSSDMPGWVLDHSVNRMGIVEKEDETLIGYCHIDHRATDHAAWISVNIGDSGYRGMGYGKEVVDKLIDFCFLELGTYSVHLDVLETNAPAIACYKKVGFTVSGKYRGHGFHDGKYLNWLHMDMLLEEYHTIRGATEVVTAQ